MKFINNVYCKIFPVLAISAFSQTVQAIPFAFEGRSLGMGGASVATADLATAAWANPAMLTNQRPSDDFSLLLGVGVFGRDDDDLRTDIDNFQAADARYQAAQTPVEELQAAQDMANIIAGLDGKAAAADVSGVAAMGMAFDSFAMALSIRADSIGASTVTNLSQTPTEVLDPTKNIVNIEGVLATEFGLSIAKDFQWSGKKTSIGIKPKFVDLQGFIYQESIRTIDDLDNVFDDGKKYDIGTFASFDLGAAIELSNSIRLGLNIRNVITDEFDLGGQKLNFDTTSRIGAAYYNRFLTVAVDYDLTENKPLLANPVYGDLSTQYLAVGAEFNAFDFAQLRIGARKNLADGISAAAKDTALTAGVGFWLGFNLDIAATFTDNSVGAFVQTGFRF